MKRSIRRHCLFAVLLGMSLIIGGCSKQDPKRIGVIFLVHGGFSEYRDGNLFDSTLQIFSYDPNSMIYQRVLWNKQMWPMIMKAGNAPKEAGKYSFEIERIGGRDPAMDLSRAQLADLTAALAMHGDELGIEFITDYAGWLAEDPGHLLQPRRIYQPGVEGDSPMNFCLDKEPDCNPERYNTDGTLERMLAAGIVVSYTKMW